MQDPEWTLDRPIEIPARDSNEFVRLAINGRFFENDQKGNITVPQLQLVRVFPSSLASYLYPYDYETILGETTGMSDSDILTFDASARMLSQPQFPTNQ